MKNFIVIQLNEFSFDLAKRYLADGTNLPNLSLLFETLSFQRTSENLPYEKLEPWIQWTSVYTGMSAEEHGVFTLGDLALQENNRLPTLFERLEKNGLSIGVLSSMGAPNRLSNPKYFIPDPWTNTRSDGSFFSERIHRILKQTVNNNSEGKITTTSALSLILLVIILFRFNISKYWALSALVFSSLRKKNKWKRCLVLDMLLNEIHKFKLKRSSAHVSFIFFNGQAHLQHHYLLNNKWSKLTNPNWYIGRDVDPVKEGFIFYDRILGDYLKIKNAKIIVATGLTQAAVTKTIIYNRLSNPDDFFSNFLNLDVQVSARMTRDIELSFHSKHELKRAKTILENLKVFPSQKAAFGHFSEVGKNLKCSFIYDDHISLKDEIKYANGFYNLHENTTFVALKNGEHLDTGYIFHNLQKFQNYEINTCAQLGHFIEVACAAEMR